MYFYGVQSPKDSLKEYSLERLPRAKIIVAPTPVETPVSQKKGKTGDITKMKPVITRCINIKEAHGNMKRTITIKYEYDRVNKVLKYGAAVHKSPVDKPEPYDRVGHHKTAEKRFETSPVTVKNFADDGQQNLFNKNLRKQLFKHGVKSK